MKSELLPFLRDEELILKIKTEGKSSYFETLYRRYYSKVLDKCYGITKNRFLAENLAEDIFSKTFEKLHSFKQISSFSSWLYSITYNHCMDYLREKKKMNYPAGIWQMEIPEIVDDTEETSEQITYDNLLTVLDLIPPLDKELLLMKYQLNLSLKEIAAVQKISECAAKMRLKRARAKVILLYSTKFLK